MPETKTLTLPHLDGKDVEVSLSLPPSLARRWTVLGLASRAPVTAAAAALGLCWGSPRKAAPRAAWASDPGAYGEAVTDDLLGRGVAYNDLADAALVALTWLGASLGGLAAGEVEAVEGFTAAPKGA